MKSKKIKQYTFHTLIGNNAEFINCVNLGKKASNSSASVLISGETGTGKELIAQSIHYGSERESRPFLAQNCAAIPRGLFEGILFGTELGGFTGAVNRKGIFEQAEGGTLLLDEVSAMPYELQGKLLRVLQEEYIRRIGGTNDIHIDVRIIATINEEPEILIKSERLRKDLFYRLNIIRIHLPPLRDRKEDIVLLANKFIEKYNKIYGKNIVSITNEGKRRLIEHNYPGNVRELENLIIAAVSMVENQSILTEGDLFRQ